MKIAIQASDLDAERIDGTRVYILNLLKYFGRLDSDSRFLIYHKNKFNPELTPPQFQNYEIKKINCPFFWTQTGFCRKINIDKPDVLWMPMHNIPVMRDKKIKTFVTIHDLAFKYFPDHFPKYDLAKLNLLAGWAIRRSDKIIAISQSTKNDILKFYPEIKDDKIRVIHHGFDGSIYGKERDLAAEKKVQAKFDIDKKYILYAGAIQPRKNLVRLIEAFNEVKKTGLDIDLVLAGGKAWMFRGVFQKIDESPFKNDIKTPGAPNFDDLGHLMRGAAAYVFPSLYEGFGIPVLEAMAAEVPVILARNSSLPEAGGEAAMYFESENAEELAKKIVLVVTDEKISGKLIEKGKLQAQKFSWEKCARETLKYLKD